MTTPTSLIDPRFLGLREFGPRNILYHEGRKYRMARCVLPREALQARLKRAKFCKVCGYFHEGDQAGADLCNHCKSTLNMANSEFLLPALVRNGDRQGDSGRTELPATKKSAPVRVTNLNCTIRFATGTDGREICDRSTVQSPEAELLRLTHGPQAICGE